MSLLGLFSPGEEGGWRRGGHIWRTSSSFLFTPNFGLQDHLNFYCTGSNLGNLILSIKCEEAEGMEYLRIILRWGCSTGRPCFFQVGLAVAEGPVRQV